MLSLSWDLLAETCTVLQSQLLLHALTAGAWEGRGGLDAQSMGVAPVGAPCPFQL